ncbi:AI-2E family transporter [Alphaproteobacteria bacterium KMM 3653]|uniref:AI-2E family transporter n=1 Tax=Harenicola maris TaxID=2841044 RepID=A0AAP2CSV3_9RHOB|nr:AI-2E family transporter [Harenicola maris]
MALPVQDQMKYWGIAAVVFFGLLYLLGDVVLPFVIGGALAYCLDPIADRLEAMGFGRVWAVVVISVIAVLAFCVVLLLVIPTLVQQATSLFETAPELFSQLQAFVTEKFPSLMVEGSSLNESIASIGSTIKERGGELLNKVIGSVSGIVNVMVLAILVPIITFYLLLDWDRMVEKIDDLLPRDHAPVLRHLAGEINQTLASFIRGQGTVCLVLGSFYAIALALVGLNFGLVVGAIAGLISFIPYIGALFGGVLAIGLALFQFWGEWGMIAAVAGIFFVGQFLEGNILTPKLVGDSVGLHPVWLIFALSAFGTLFGFVGLLVAVPVTAMIGVVVRFFIHRYKDGRLYRGLEAEEQGSTGDS